MMHKQKKSIIIFIFTIFLEVLLHRILAVVFAVNRVGIGALMLRNLTNLSVSRWFMVSGVVLIMGLLILYQNVSSFAAGREPKPEQFLTLGAGPAADARFGLGGLIATGLAAPLNGPACERGGPCGVQGVMVAARR